MDIFAFIDVITQSATRTIGSIFILVGLVLALYTVVRRPNITGIIMAGIIGGAASIIGAAIIIVGELIRNTLEQTTTVAVASQVMGTGIIG